MSKPESNAPDSAGELNVGIHQRFGGFQLAIEFRVPLGLLVLFGASGAGKSLTLRALAGSLHLKGGHVALDGQALFDSALGLDLPPQERRVGYVPQHYALFPHLTVAENVRFGLRGSPGRPQRLPWGKERARQRARVSELLMALELQGFEKRYPPSLSGGQLQRVALARALAAEPRLLLLDEPFNALDAAVRERLREALKQFQRKFAVPIVLVTHDHEEAQQLADTIVVLQHGRVVQVGSPQEVFLAPRSAEVAELVGQRNFFAGYLASPPGEGLHAPAQALRLSWLQASSDPQQVHSLRNNAELHAWLPLPPTPPQLIPHAQRPVTGCILTAEVLVHPWQQSELPPPTWTAQGAMRWPAILLEARLAGHGVRLLVRPQWAQARTTDALEIYLDRRGWRDSAWTPGQPLLLEIGPQAIYCF